MAADWTIGFATYQDFHGANFTMQSLLLHHPEVAERCEFVVVDQTDPKHPHARDLMAFVNHVNGSGVRARYSSMTDPKGTSPPRQQVFEQATTPHVMCIDGHVLFHPGSIKALTGWFDENPRSKDLLHGLLMLDDRKNYYSHMEPLWREQMLGIWGVMWKCKSCDRKFDVMHGDREGGGSRALFFQSPVKSRFFNENQPYMKCACGQQMPDLWFEGHEAHLLQEGFIKIGDDPNEPPFEIPAHGLGMFACRKEMWEKVGGFNRFFRGFGGEECYIHQKFRNKGSKVWVHPQIRWWHRFGRPDGAPYRLAQLDKVRNYVLGHLEMGEHTELVWKHWGGGYKLNDPITRQQFENIVRMAKKQEYPKGGFDIHEGPNSGSRRVVNPANPSSRKSQGVRIVPTLDEMYESLKSTPRDLDQHLEVLKSFAVDSTHATELSSRKESTIALLAAHPKRVVSFNMEKTDPLFMSYHEAFDTHERDSGDKRTFTSTHSNLEDIVWKDFEETDFVFINTPHERHNADYLTPLLRNLSGKVRKHIAVHDTSGNGEIGDNGREGLNESLRQFLKDNPDWFVAFFNPNQYGLTVLSNQEKFRPPKPIQAWPHGPGTELKAILASLGIQPSVSCDCNAKARQMDAWGPEGCRKNFDIIVKWMQEGAPNWGWLAYLSAAANAVATGLAFKINPTDPFPGIVEQAIKRAEEKEGVESPAVTPKTKKKKWIKGPEEKKPVKKDQENPYDSDVVETPKQAKKAAKKSRGKK